MSGPHHGLTRLDQLVKTSVGGEGPNRPFAQTLGRLFPANPVQVQNIGHSGVIDALDKLACNMGVDQNTEGLADAGMTFLGQFIDHDVTLDATSALGSRMDPSTIPNVRTPSLDLDCVYGAGPEASAPLYGRGEAEQFLVFGRKDNPLDLARTCAGKALIGDPRNDENILVAQVHSLFIELHNLLMSLRVEDGEEAKDISACARDGMGDDVWANHVHPRLSSFEEVRRFIRLHYQWVVWNEFLPAFVQQECLDWAMAGNGFGWNAPVMPVEFTGACYRFGHATTQFAYTLRDGTDPVELFAMQGFGPRDISGNIDFDLFFTLKDGAPAQTARPVAPKLGQALLDLPFVHDGVTLGNGEASLSVPQARSLPLRNMVRDRYTYELASGQQVAARLGTPLVDVPPELAAVGITKTPLWFYSLQEAEAFGDGKLTGVGGRIVASVFANLLKRDPTTYVHVPGFEPWHGFNGSPSVFAGMINYVLANRSKSKYVEDLRCG